MAKFHDDFVDYYYDVGADSYEPDFKVASSAKQLKSLRKRIDWTSRKERLKLLRELCPLIVAWEGRLPTNLRHVFRQDEVDWLLIESVDSYKDPTETQSLIDFVVSTNYRDRPRVDEETGKPIVRRTTAIHHAARRGLSFPKKYILKLFQIYDRFDVDYADERTGLTHFEVACEYGCDDVVDKFLEAGGWQDPSGPWRDTGDSLLLFALKRRHWGLAEVLLRRGADPNAANEAKETPLLVIVNYDYGYSFASKFFRVAESSKQRVRVDAADAWGNTALCYAAFHGCAITMALLAARDADPNLANVYGSTPLHIICERYNAAALADYFLQINEKHGRTVRVNAQDNEGNAPLHLALMSHANDHADHRGLARLLLGRGADPSLANAEGSTPLHLACAKYANDDDTLRTLFDICDELNQEVRIDARDNEGNTTLLLALQRRDWALSEFLLSRGADPNLANNKGETSLHFACDREYDSAMLSWCCRMCDELNRPVLIDAQDQEGDTPLHWALIYGESESVKLLLRRGANLNLANAKGQTPLHVMCRRQYHCSSDSLVRACLEICDELNRPMQLDAPDEAGRTALQWAVVSSSPRAVDALLDRGADASKFVFPDDAHLAVDGWAHVACRDAVGKLTHASVALAIVERLAERGYQLDRGEAAKIMNALVTYELVEKEAGVGGEAAGDLDVLRDHELYRLRAEEARRLFTYEDCHDYAWSLEWGDDLTEAGRLACALRLCEKLWRGFFRSWALYPLWDLIGQRLPLLCCQMIVENLSNEDSWRICRAAEGLNS